MACRQQPQVTGSQHSFRITATSNQPNKQTSPQAKRHKLSLHSLFKLPWILSKYNFYHHILIFIIFFIHFYPSHPLMFIFIYFYRPKSAYIAILVGEKK